MINDDLLHLVDAAEFQSLLLEELITELNRKTDEFCEQRSEEADKFYAEKSK